MRFSLQREALLKPLQQVVGVVERRQTLPVLSNLLVSVGADGVSFTGTDLEVEMIARASAEDLIEGEVTIPARKLFDICRALPDGARIKVELSGERVSVSAGRSRFTLTTLPPVNSGGRHYRPRRARDVCPRQPSRTSWRVLRSRWRPRTCVFT